MSKEYSQLQKASDFYEDISEFCQPCSVEGKRLQSDRFCVDCQEYLCRKCSTHHKALKATQNHALVTTDDAKKVKPSPTNDKCSSTCTVHKHKSIQFFCVTHSYLGCSVCMTMDHNQCQIKEYIPEVAENIRSYDGFKEFDVKLKTMATTCKVSIANVQKNLKQIGSDERQLKEAMKEFRKKMNTAFDKFENELTAQAKQINSEETKTLNVMSKKLAKSLSEVDTLLNQVNTLLSSGKHCDTYVLMRKEASHLVALNNELVNTTKGKTYKRYDFQPNNDILTSGAFGKLISRTESVSPISEKTVSSLCIDDSTKTKVKVSIARSQLPSKLGQIQPGSRVCLVNFFARRLYGSGGTVKHFDSSSGKWKVIWDNGYTNYYSKEKLEILEQR